MPAMDNNPYTSPTSDESQARTSRGLLILRFVAIILWLISAFGLYAILVSWNHPGIVAMRTENPTRFARVGIVCLGLPVLGIAILGTACWRRGRLLALLGVAAF